MTTLNHPDSMFKVKAPLPKHIDRQLKNQLLLMFVVGNPLVVMSGIGMVMLLNLLPIYFSLPIIGLYLAVAWNWPNYTVRAAYFIAAVAVVVYRLPAIVGVFLWAGVLGACAIQFARHWLYLETASPMNPETAQRLRAGVDDGSAVGAFLTSPFAALAAGAFCHELCAAWQSWVAYHPPEVPGIEQSPVGTKDQRLTLTYAATAAGLLPTTVIVDYLALSSIRAGQFGWHHLAILLFGYAILPGVFVLVACLGTLTAYLPQLQKGRNDDNA